MWQMRFILIVIHLQFKALWKILQFLREKNICAEVPYICELHWKCTPTILHQVSLNWLLVTLDCQAGKTQKNNKFFKTWENIFAVYK